VQFYREVFGLDVNFSSLKIPKRPPEFTRLLVLAKGLTLKRIIETSKKYYRMDNSPSGRYFFGDEETRGVHDRMPTETYAVWVRDQVDPDLKYTDFPPRLLKERGVQGITLIEYLLFDLKYFRESCKLLDRNKIATLCFGSRDQGGCIPCVYFSQPFRHVDIGYGWPGACVREVAA
jgi:hypothetical protein